MAKNEDVTTPIIRGNAYEFTLTSVVDSEGATIDQAGWHVTLFIRKKADASAELLAKAATLTGAYDAVPALDTQTWTVSVSAAETEAMRDKDDDKLDYAWKRVDVGFEQDLRYGEIPIVRTASR